MHQKRFCLLLSLLLSAWLAVCSAGLEAHITYDPALKFSGDKAYETLAD